VSALADAIQAVLEAKGPLPAGDVAVGVRKRKSVVVEALRSDARFVHTGKTKASRWDVQKTSFDAAELAARCNCDPEMAAEFLFGPGGFLERGFVASLNGNGRVVVTELGLTVSATVEALA
jgi:hypothetical protein